MTTATRSAEAVWTGRLKDGNGHFISGSKVLSADYSFATRFGRQRGTNPEELIAVAHASCFSMALAFYLEQAGAPPECIRASADVVLEIGDDGPSIKGIHLRVAARVPKLSDDAFQTIAAAAKEACLVSRLLKTSILLEARLDR